MYRFLSIFLVPPLPCSLFWEDVVLSPFKRIVFSHHIYIPSVFAADT